MAKGYIAAAECMEKLNRKQDAVRHYREMLERPELKDTDEVKTAAEALERLGLDS